MHINLMLATNINVTWDFSWIFVIFILFQAILGGKVEVPTLLGKTQVNVSIFVACHPLPKPVPSFP